MLCITVRKGKLYRMHISIYNTPQILRVLASLYVMLPLTILTSALIYYTMTPNQCSNLMPMTKAGRG